MKFSQGESDSIPPRRLVTGSSRGDLQESLGRPHETPRDPRRPQEIAGDPRRPQGNIPKSSFRVSTDPFTTAIGLVSPSRYDLQFVRFGLIALGTCSAYSFLKLIISVHFQDADFWAGFQTGLDFSARKAHSASGRVGAGGTARCATHHLAEWLECEAILAD